MAVQSDQRSLGANPPDRSHERHGDVLAEDAAKVTVRDRMGTGEEKRRGLPSREGLSIWMVVARGFEPPAPAPEADRSVSLRSS